jgi:hypothetical protein
MESSTPTRHDKKSMNRSVSIHARPNAGYGDMTERSSSVKSSLVSCPTAGCLFTSTEEQKTTKKMVRFVDRPKVNFFYKHDNLDSCLWFGKHHLRETTKELEEIGKQWQAKGYDVLFKDVYTNACRDQLDIYVQLPGADYMRGAETWLCDSLHNERSVTRKHAVETTIQKEIQLKADSKKSPEDVAQELAALYKELSRPAQDFAKRMGMADELGDKLGENPELPRYILLNKDHRAGLTSFTQKSMEPSAITFSLARFVTTMATAIGA